jgi:hypothetical protein
MMRFSAAVTRRVLFTAGAAAPAAAATAWTGFAAGTAGCNEVTAEAEAWTAA